MRRFGSTDGPVRGADWYAGGPPPRNPSHNSLAVGPDYIVQTVNSQVPIFRRAVPPTAAAAIVSR